LKALSLFVVALLAFSTLATSFISCILGMVGGMILMGVLLALLPLPSAMLLHGVVQLAANGWRALMSGRDAPRRGLSDEWVQQYMGWGGHLAPLWRGTSRATRNPRS